MRVLAVGSMYPPHHFGGYEVLWRGAMQRLRQEGDHVRVLASTHREPEIDGPEDPDVHRVLEWYWSWEEYGFRHLSPFQRLGLERRNAERLSRHLEEFNPDVVTFWPMGGMSLGLIEQVRRTGKPSVLVVIDDWLVYGPKVDAWLRLWGRARMLASPAERISGLPTRFRHHPADRILFTSEFIRQRAADHGVLLDNTAVVSPGIEARFLEAAPERPWEWKLLCIGRIDRQKGIDTAIAALEKLPTDTQLTIAGAGDSAYISELHDQVARLGLGERVTFTGPVPREGVAELIAEADAVLFPVRWDEPWGLVPLEAMGIGRPVVATAGGGSAEFLRDGENALVFEADDADGLAACVRHLAEAPDLRDRLRAHGISTAAAHTAQGYEDRIREELELAASGATPSALRRPRQ